MDRELSLAKKIYRKYKTNDPFQICEESGHIVLFVPLTGVRGYYQHIIRNNIIYINESLPEHVQRFVCAHELGHSLMHRDSNAIYLDSRTFQVVGKYEKAANRFSAGLLYPEDEELLEYADCSLDQLTKILGLPSELVKWRYGQIKK